MIFYCCHSARRALARSCRIHLFFESVNLSLNREGPVWVNEGFGNVGLLIPHSPAAMVPPLPIREVYLL